MDPTVVITLLDSIWFNLEIFKKHPPRTNPPTNPHHPNQENSQEPKTIIIHKRSKSDQQLIPTMAPSSSLSPDSVLLLPPPHLQTILSGKETTSQGGFEEQSTKQSRVMRRRRPKRAMFTKSLSDLEFEELKGLNDLGFVFSEDELDPSLVEIVPGLQRLGKKEGEKTEHCGGHRNSCSSCYDESLVRRPYLSEAWEVEDTRRERNNNPLMGWKINASSEIDMKDSLKWWAHTVASTVK